MNPISDFFRRRFSDPQMILLAVFLIAGSLLIVTLGDMLAPAIASLIIAYLLEGLINRLERRNITRLVAVTLVFLTFMVFLLFMIVGLLPLLWQQVGDLFQELPSMIAWSQKQLSRLPERYAVYVSEQQLVNILNMLRSELTTVGQRILSLSLASVRVLIWVLVYIFLVPLMVFFFLKDKDRLIRWATSFLPEERTLAAGVWHEVDQQIGNYVRGKFWEILIVWAASYVTFILLRLNYAMLIGFFVGLSVLIPYIGATAITVPVALIAYFQWGWSSEFAYAVTAYVIIQILDGNVLVPFLFSEVVNLHPIAIILAVLVFGGMFGFWGVFFAIPLATLVQAVLKAWLEADRGLRPNRSPKPPPTPRPESSHNET